MIAGPVRGPQFFYADLNFCTTTKSGKHRQNRNKKIFCYLVIKDYSRRPITYINDTGRICKAGSEQRGHYPKDLSSLWSHTA